MAYLHNFFISLLLIYTIQPQSSFASSIICKKLEKTIHFRGDTRRTLFELASQYDLTVSPVTNNQAEDLKIFLRDMRRLEHVDASASKSLDQDLDDILTSYNKRNGIVIVLKKNEKIVGCAALYQIEPQIAEIRKIYLAKDYLGKGLGKSLTIEMIESAERLSYSRVELETYRHMTTAQLLYRSLGFREFQADRLKDEPNVIAMFLELK
jgi:ribosomal protein S18 acetylase RimI-like enzyme